MHQQIKPNAPAGYINLWGITEKPQFSDMEMALMQGGHSIETEPKPEKYSFIKLISSNRNN
jgi:hypothetical protein